MRNQYQEKYVKSSKEVHFLVKEDVFVAIRDFLAENKKPFATYARAALFEKLEKDGFFDDFPDLKVRKK